MKSAERTYVDPSALRSLYVHDDRSARFCVLHVATAVTLEARRFVSYDDRQAARAKAVGLRVLAP